MCGEKLRNKYGIDVPNTIADARRLDKENGDTLWMDSVAKELEALEKLKVFRFHEPGKQMGNEYQYAPLRFVFDVKQEDLRRKGRLVLGGHVIDSSEYENYASTVQSILIRLLLTIAEKNGLRVMSGDVGNVFPNADTQEKIYSRAGMEFGERQGCIIEVVKSLYGLSTSARHWKMMMEDFIRDMGFKPTRVDQNVWYKIEKETKKYTYISTYVDDFMILGGNPEYYMEKFISEFVI